MTDQLPKMLAVEAGGPLRTLRMDISQGPGGYLATVSVRVLGFEVATLPPRPVDDDHVRKVYEEYDVVEEVDAS
jgi:hypothetical protein